MKCYISSHTVIRAFHWLSFSKQEDKISNSIIIQISLIFAIYINRFQICSNSLREHFPIACDFFSSEWVMLLKDTMGSNEITWMMSTSINCNLYKKEALLKPEQRTISIQQVLNCHQSNVILNWNVTHYQISILTINYLQMHIPPPPTTNQHF